MNITKDKYKCLDTINFYGEELSFYNIKVAERNGLDGVTKLPYSYKILLENLLRNLDDVSVRELDVHNLLKRKIGLEIQFKPSRVLMQDYTGVPAVADLAAMRDSMKKSKKDPNIINPLVPVSLIIDHSLIADSAGTKESIKENIEEEFSKNLERYKLLKWAQASFENFKVFPPGSGICHQINLEYLADVVNHHKNLVFFDTVVGTDSHTTMINALSVLGWGVGGIEAEAVMLGQSISMQIPDVVGVKLTGKLGEGVTATDLVLTITERLRELGVVGKFVEFFGCGLGSLSLSERSTISNMAPEYGATCGLFPVDQETIEYLKLTGRNENQVSLVEEYSKKQGLWLSNDDEIVYNNVLEIDLNKVLSSIAGPKRPQDRVPVTQSKNNFLEQLTTEEKEVLKREKSLNHGSVCIASITSCTNTSNPAVLIAAGLIAKKADELGVKIPSWVKTSFAPGSQVVEQYLQDSALLRPLNSLGFNIIGYGCTTCIGNSGSLKKEVEKKIQDENLNVCSVISGNRNFEGRIHPLIKSNYLSSPPLVMIYAIAGKINIDITRDVITKVKNKDIFLKDLWPDDLQVQATLNRVLKKNIFVKKYKDIMRGDKNWQSIKINKSETFDWSVSSTYIKKPPFLELEKDKKLNINNAKALLVLGDSVTTDHISPAGVIKPSSSAGKYLTERQVSPRKFNSFGARRGNHEIMVRGTFANVRIRNQMVEKEGGYSIHFPSMKVDDVFNIAQEYKKDKVPLVVVAGKEYGTGSSRDWAAKGTKLLGIKAVIAESFERIHRSNLVGMGVLPLELIDIPTKELSLNGDETFDLGDLKYYQSKPGMRGEINIYYNNKRAKKVKVKSRIDTKNEINFFVSNGILPYVIEQISKK